MWKGAEAKDLAGLSLAFTEVGGKIVAPSLPLNENGMSWVARREGTFVVSIAAQDGSELKMPSRFF
jgi:hypothetical protein